MQYITNTVIIIFFENIFIHSLHTHTHVQTYMHTHFFENAFFSINEEKQLQL